jgi:hypothetical protein
MENNPLSPHVSQLQVGDGCPYCAHLFRKASEILNCYYCGRQGCSDCVAAEACCLEDNDLESDE